MTHDNLSEQRPWGRYTVLHNSQTQGYKVKHIQVNPLQRLSLQSHKHRSEYWTIVSGDGIVEINDTKIIVSKGSTVQIYKEDKHRIQNTSSTHPLIFIEVQMGDYLGEDDIVRYQDDYQRN